MNGRTGLKGVARRAMCVLCSLALALMLVPAVALTQAGVTIAEAAEDATTSGELTDGWNQFGTCEWQIDDEGTLTIRPLGNGTSGTLGDMDFYYQDDDAVYTTIPWYAQRASITSVIAKPGVTVGPSMAKLFYGCSSLTNVDLSGFDTSDVITMTSMFEGCTSLAFVDLSSLDTSKVEYMSSMFKGCSSLASLNLSGLDTSNVMSLAYMFEGCSSLAFVDLSSLDTSKVEYMSSMFEGCSSLASLNLSGLDTSNVMSLADMFEGCSSLASLDLSGFNTSSVRSMSGMFEGCSSLTSLDLSSFDTSAVEDAIGMFADCSLLTSVNLDGLDMSAVESMSAMFQNCTSLVSLDFSGVVAFSAVYMSGMFFGCSSLKTLDLTRWNLSRTKSIDYMFYGCQSLEQVPTGFSFPDGASKSKVFYCPFSSVLGELQRIYYSGDDESILNYDWASDNRTLVTDDSGDSDPSGGQDAELAAQEIVGGKKAVSFKAKKATGKLAKGKSFKIGCSAAHEPESATLSYELLKVSAKKVAKLVKVSKDGKVTLKKGLPKGTYKIKVKVTAAATANYSAATKVKTITIKVK